MSKGESRSLCNGPAIMVGSLPNQRPVKLADQEGLGLSYIPAVGIGNGMISTLLDIALI